MIDDSSELSCLSISTDRRYPRNVGFTRPPAAFVHRGGGWSGPPISCHCWECSSQMCLRGIFRGLSVFREHRDNCERNPMKLARRRILQLATSAAAVPAFPCLGRAEAYPSRPVRLLDGYTLLEASTSNAWNATIYQNVNFDFIRDIAPVASTVQTYNVLVTNLSFPAQTVPELIAYGKANPGKINMGSAGPGSSPHLYGELFKAMAGVDLVTVHYRGDGPAIPDLIGGQIQVMFGSVVTWIEQIKSGKVRALAVTSAARRQLLPD